MRRLTEGYTIVEVTIVLAVGMSLLVPAMLLIQNKQAQTDFNQKVRDAQSQLQTWVGNVSSGYSGADHSNMHCALVSNRPVIQTGAPGAGYYPNCVYLGEAIQFTDRNIGITNDSLIYAYPVFGTRLDSTTGQLASNLRGSSPEPAVGWNSSVNLTQTLNLSPLYIAKVGSTGTDAATGGVSAITNSHLVGFYNSINTNATATANGQLDVNAYQYKFSNSNQSAGAAGQASYLAGCLEMTSALCINPSNNYPDSLNSLDVCLSDGNRFAQLLITSTAGIGGDVTVNYKNSLVNC